MNHPSLEARTISRTFGNVKAVNNVSLRVDAGQVVVLLGKSGSGKSTLLRLLAGLERVDAGEIFAGGERVSSPARVTPPEQRGLGMVFQDYALFPHLSALGNVAFGLAGVDKAKAHQIALDWLEKVGLSDRATYFPHQLSGGEQQRVALARALAPSPSAVLMDEPFSGLDPHLRGDLQRTMLTALRAANVAAIIVSHDTEEALAIADQIAIMDQGRLVQSGTPSAVYASPVSLEAARALGPVWTYSCQAENGTAVTPFGTFLTTATGRVVVAARPETTLVTVDENAPFHVTDVRGVGRFVTATLEHGDLVVQARMEAKDAPKVGASAHVAVAPADAFVFGGEA